MFGPRSSVLRSRCREQPVGRLAALLFAFGTASALAQGAAAPLVPTDGGGEAPQPVIYSEELVITAPRGRPAGTSAAATTVVAAEEIVATPAQSVDQVLRGLPGVALPRGDSHVLHPTGQGLSLRGVGRGRTLVLLDGVPLNDPFGGWIEWNKVAKSQLGGIELTRGASSNVYGSLAMGGVVQLFTRPVERQRLSLEADFGARDTPHVAFSAASPVGSDFSVSASGDTFRTDGYVRVAPEQRGPVDVPSRYASQNASLRGTWTQGRWSGKASLGYFRDEATSGTPLTPNRRWSADGSVGLSAELGPGKLELLAFGGRQRFFNSNARVEGDRQSERLSLRQDIPVGSAGGSLMWSQRLGAQQQLVAGLDLRWVEGTNQEALFGATGPTGARSSGGRQTTGGVFAAWTGRVLDRLTLGAGLRADGWWNEGRSQPSDEDPAVALPGRTDAALSPRVSGIVQASDRLALRGAGYAGFRAPNLNELYRGYFSGQVQVTPNPELGPERLWGGEVGVDWEPLRDTQLSATLFADRTTDLIEQVTLNASTRQRRNLAQASAAGLEVEASFAPWEALVVRAGYAFTASRVVRYPEDPALEGNWLPEVPRHAGSLWLQWRSPRWVDLDARLRVEGSTFADDRNALPLPAFALVDLGVSRRLREEVTVFASVSNLLDTRVITDRTEALDFVGAPRTIWGGFQVSY